MAIAATALLSSGNIKTFALEISASAFVTNLGGYVSNGDIHAAEAALEQLRSLGVKQLRVGKRAYTLTELMQLLNSPDHGQAIFSQLVAAILAEAPAYFVAENRTIVSVNWTQTQPELFPTGSTG